MPMSILKIFHSHWIPYLLIINSLPHKMKGGRIFRTMGIKRGGRKGYQFDQNPNLIERWFHYEGRGRLIRLALRQGWIRWSFGCNCSTRIATFLSLISQELTWFVKMVLEIFKKNRYRTESIPPFPQCLLGLILWHTVRNLKLNLLPIIYTM